MDLIQIEDLIRRLKEGMEEEAEGVEKTMFAPASEYAECCERANERLKTCVEILSKGRENRFQALMAATSPPDVLDVCALLSELQTEEWRQFCRRNHLPVPAQLNDGFKQQVDALYEGGGDFQLTLRSEFNAAQTKRDYREALNVARQIHRLDPSDESMARQVEKLEDQCVREVIGWMEKPLQEGNERAILAFLSEIDEIAPGRKPGKNEDILVRCLEVRSRVLRDEAIEAARRLVGEALLEREKGNVAGVLERVSRVNALMEEHDFLLDPMDRKSHDSLGEWSGEEVRLLKIEDERQREIRELEQTLKVIEDKEFRSAKPSLSENRSDANAIQRQWKSIAEYGREVDPELQGRAKKLLGDVERKIELRERARRRNLTAGILAGSMILVATSLFAVFLYKANQEAARLARCVTDKRAGDLEQRIEVLETDSPIWLGLGKLPGEMEAGRTWLAGEKAIADRVNEAIASLEEELRGGDQPGGWTDSALASLKQRRERIMEDSRGVIEDYRLEMEDRLARVEREWRSVVDGIRPDRVSAFHEGVSDLELAMRDELDFERPPAEVSRSIAEVGGRINDLNRLANTEVAELKPSIADLTKFEVLKERFSLAEGEADRAREIMRQCREARDLPGYLDAIGGLPDTGFLEGAQKAALNKMLLGIRTEDHVLGQILTGTDASLWARLKSGSFPDTGFPMAVGGEKGLLFGLRDDEKLRDIYRYDLRDGGRTRVIYSIGKIEARSFEIEGLTQVDYVGNQIYDSGRSEGDRAVFKTEKYHLRRSSQGSSGAAPEGERLSPESAAFRNLRLGDYLTQDGSSYRKSLLEFLEELFAKRADPVFKAYLHWHIGEVIAENKDAWLVEFTEFDRDFWELKDLIDRNVGPTDWCAPEKYEERRGDLAAFYDRLSGKRYAKPALAVATVYNRLHAAGVRYCGFLSIEGEPILTGNLRADEIWGVDSAFRISRLFSRDESGGWESIADPNPLSPLFFLPFKPEVVLASVGDEVGIDMNVPEVMSRLPERLYAGAER